MTRATGTPRVGRGRRPTRGGGAFTLGVLVAMLTTVSLRSGEYAVPDATLVGFALAAWAPLLVRTYRPLFALAGTVLVESLHIALIPVVDPEAVQTALMAAYQPVPLATVAAAFTVATRLPRRDGWYAGLGAAGVLLVVALTTRPLSLLSTDVVMANLVVTATAVGSVVAGRHERIAQTMLDREGEKERAVVDERLRIARELHDVVAHNITLVNAQAAVAHYLLRTDPDAAALALQDISTHSARAIDDLRATIGLLRDDSASPDATAPGALRPVPDLDRLDELLDGFRAARTPVELTVTGERRALLANGEAAVYRIVQEAVTNATKHAPGIRVRVHLDWSVDALSLRVLNGAPTDALRRRPAAGTGHGLIGMRERALAAGGTFRTGRQVDGGFLVEASLPARRLGTDDGRLADGPIAKALS